MTILIDTGRTQFVRQAAFRRQILQLIRATPYDEPYNDYMVFFHDNRDHIVECMKFNGLDPAGNMIKGVFYLHARMVLINEDGEIEKHADHFFRSEVSEYPLNASSDERDEIFNRVIAEIAHKIVIYTAEASGWTFDHVIFFDMSISQFNYNSRRGRAMTPPELPSSLSKRRGILKISVTNEQYKKWNCFQQAICISDYISHHDTAKIPNKHSEFLTTWLKLFDDTNYSLPAFTNVELNKEDVSVDDIYLFENDNPNYFVTVLGWEENQFLPLRSFKHAHYSQMTDKDKLHLIFIFYYEGHFYPIKSLNRVLNEKGKRYLHYCPFCLQGFKDRDYLEMHMSYCAGFAAQCVMMPEEGKVVCFSNHIAAQRHPIVFYADTESCLEPMPDKSGTKGPNLLNRHIPCMAGYYLAFTEEMKHVLNEEINQEKLARLLPEYPEGLYKSFFGKDCMTQFLDSLFDITERLFDLFNCFKMPLPNVAKDFCDAAQKCIICDQPFIAEKEDKVVDHDHFTGLIRGVAHNECNMKCKKKRNFFPVIFHNFKGYDGHALCKTAKFSNREDVQLRCIPLTTEKYLSLSIIWKVCEYKWYSEEKQEDEIKVLKNELRFIDSFQFLSESLEKLVVQQYSDGGNATFPHIQMQFQYDHVALCLRKGIYPYEYMDSLDRFNETALPSIETFTSKLREGDACEPADYEHATRVWAETHCKTLRDYTEFYMKTDIILLADIFESFRSTCIRIHNMDPVFTFTLPGFSWQAALRQSGQKLELLTDYSMYTTIEQGIRGGLTVCTRHYAEADNFYTNPFKYRNANSDSSHIQVYDANSLYAWAMSQSLPYGDFKWLENFNDLFPPNLNKWPSDDGEYGYILVVDLEYPKEIHDQTATYPLAPCHENINADIYTIHMLEQWLISRSGGMKVRRERKLVASCNDKENYVVHYRTLKLYVKLGLRIKKISQVIQFKQSKWLAPYISGNIARRKQAKCTFESDFHKKANNAVFGKTQEQKRGRQNFLLTSNEKDIQFYVSKPSYDGSLIFSEDLVGIFRRKMKLLLDQPIYVGFTVLDLSKLLMFDFFYNVVQPLFPSPNNSVEVLYTDTDSLHLLMKGENMFEKLISIRDEWIDGSNLDIHHPLYSMHNKGVIGKFKEEMNGKPITGLVALRPKMYCIQTTDMKDKKRAKGIKKAVIEKSFNFNDYVKVYKGECEPMYAQQTTLQSKLHQVYTLRQTKKALALFDNKRMWTDDNTSLPYGHYLANEKLKIEETERRKWLLEKCNQDFTQKKERPLQRKGYKHPDHWRKKNFVDQLVPTRKRKQQLTEMEKEFENDKYYHENPQLFVCESEVASVSKKPRIEEKRYRPNREHIMEVLDLLDKSHEKTTALFKLVNKQPNLLDRQLLLRMYDIVQSQPLLIQIVSVLRR